MRKKTINNFFTLDVSSLSNESLVEIIKQLEDSAYITVRKKVQRELVKRLKEKRFDNKKIAAILTSNVYGMRRRSAIAKEWADALEISVDEFFKLISVSGK